MKILAFSDTHRDVGKTRSILAGAQDADVLVGAGDFGTAGRGMYEIIEVIAAENIPTVLVHGNHDNAAELIQICAAFPNIHLLHGQAVEIAGIPFFGIGGEIPRRHGETWNEAMSEDAAAKLLCACPDHAVLVTHTPPYECADLQRNGKHEGSKAIRAVITDKQPLITLCGHIHFSWGAKGMIDATQVYNLGPSVNWFEV